MSKKTKLPTGIAEGPGGLLEGYSQLRGWSVIEYVTEEVTRQGHDVLNVDGIERVGWMLNAWGYALWRSEAKEPKPTIFDVRRLGQMVEPLRNPDDFRNINMQVRTATGIKQFSEWYRVPRLLEELVAVRDAIKPMEFYQRFEEIHPFVDGNGRTGKILLNWLNGTLLAPIFPPNDIFGYPIRNP